MKEVTDEGSQIIQELLQTWIAQASRPEGEDVDMDGDTAEQELRILKETVEKYKDRIEGNPWIQNLLTTL